MDSPATLLSCGFCGFGGSGTGNVPRRNWLSKLAHNPPPALTVASVVAGQNVRVFMPQDARWLSTAEDFARRTDADPTVVRIVGVIVRVRSGSE